MPTCRFSRKLSLVCGFVAFTMVWNRGLAQPTRQATAAFDSYVGDLEARLAQQHRSRIAFLAGPGSTPQSDARLRQGELIIERLTPPGESDPPGALLHHWRGTAFVSGVTADDLERLLKDLNHWPQEFSPQVLQARVVTQDDSHLQAWMRVREHHIVSVVMDATYDVTFGRLDAQHRYSLSRSTRISAANGDKQPADGLLWRLNTYWSYEERDGGVYLQIEALSLTRSVPAGLGWLVNPLVESVPRESLEFTLRSTCTALHRKAADGDAK